MYLLRNSLTPAAQALFDKTINEAKAAEVPPGSASAQAKAEQRAVALNRWSERLSHSEHHLTQAMLDGIPDPAHRAEVLLAALTARMRQKGVTVTPGPGSPFMATTASAALERLLALDVYGDGGAVRSRIDELVYDLDKPNRGPWLETQLGGRLRFDISISDGLLSEVTVGAENARTHYLRHGRDGWAITTRVTDLGVGGSYSTSTALASLTQPTLEFFRNSALTAIGGTLPENPALARLAGPAGGSIDTLTDLVKTLDALIAAKSEATKAKEAQLVEMLKKAVKGKAPPVVGRVEHGWLRSFLSQLPFGKSITG
ncbi:MAG: hypothetical protein U1E65_05615 [Myxococcota bacterium]